MSELHTKMTALANAVREKAGVSDKLTIDGMTEAVSNLRVGGTDTSDATASAADILFGKTAYVGGEKVFGTIRSLTGGIYTVAQENIGFAAGYYTAGEIIFKGEPNLLSDYIKIGVKIGTVTGTFTADGTAAAGDILEGKTAYVKGNNVSGTIKSVEASVEGNVVTIPSGYIAEEQVVTVGEAVEGYTIHPRANYQIVPKGSFLTGDILISGDPALDAENIKVGVNIFGVEGTFTADATAESADILAGKTAYVNGEKVTGALVAGSAFFPVWQSIESRVFPVVFEAENVQTPSNRSQNFLVVDGKLLYIPQDMGEAKILFPEMTWTYARTRMGSDNARAYAISEGKLYHIDYDSNNEYIYTCLTPGMTGVTQVVDASPDWVFFLAGTNIYIGSDDGPNSYTQIEGISVRKIINQPGGYSSAIVITADGSVAKVYQGEYDNATGKWLGDHEVLFESNGDAFQSIYYAEPEEFEGGMGGGGYALAVRGSGLWYYTPGSSSWSRVYGIDMPLTSLPGFCATYADEAYEWNEETGEEKWWLQANESTIAFCVTAEGKGYVLRAKCDSDGNLSGIGVEALSGNAWQYLPPYMGNNETAWAQFNGKLFKIKTSRPAGESRISFELTEYKMAAPSGRLVAAFDKNLFFAPPGVVVDMNKAGGFYNAQG